MPATPEPPRPNSDRMAAIAKYSGIAFQMLATIGLSAWFGTFLDRRLALKYPWFTVSLLLLGVLMALWQVIRGLTKES
jgi:F0F1-type ATP synthase assembly protein I